MWRGRLLAPKVDGRAAFDAYGVTMVTMPPGAALPEGKLNALLAETERDERCWPTPEADTYLRRIRNQDKVSPCLGGVGSAVPGRAGPASACRALYEGRAGGGGAAGRAGRREAEPGTVPGPVRPVR